MPSSACKKKCRFSIAAANCFRIGDAFPHRHLCGFQLWLLILVELVMPISFAIFPLFQFFFFNDTETTEIYTLSLHDALPICFCEARTRSTTRPVPAAVPIAAAATIGT